MKALMTVAACALCVLGCQTPPIVNEAMNMSLIAQKSYEADATATIESLYEEIKAQSRARYVSDFRMVEATLLEEQGDTGLVDLNRYKSYADRYAVEMAKEDTFWDNMQEQTKLKLQLKSTSAKRLAESVLAYNSAQDVPPELWDELFQNTAQGIIHISDYRKQQDALESSDDPRFPNLDNAFEILSGKIETQAEESASNLDLTAAYARLQAILRGEQQPTNLNALIARIRELLGRDAQPVEPTE